MTFLSRFVVVFWSYLIGRKQAVCILSRESEPYSLLYGISQGSVLRPILFIVYTQLLSDSTEQHSALHCLPMTHSCTIQLLALALILFSAN